MKRENTPSQDTIKAGETIELSTRFGGLSHGKCWGKFYANKTRATGGFEWVEKDKSGTLFLTGPGFYEVGSGDGFSRKARGSFTLISAAELTVEEKIARQEKLLAASEGKDPDGLVTTSAAGLGFTKGQVIRRGTLMDARKARIAELRASLNRETVIGSTDSFA